VSDPYRRRMEVASHESGHALAMYLCGRRIAEIDISRPDSWADGWVVPGPSEPLLMPPDGVDVFSYVDAHLERASRETAVIARMGALVAGDDWLSPEVREGLRNRQGGVSVLHEPRQLGDLGTAARRGDAQGPEV
jgi:hypothetical protein